VLFEMAIDSKLRGCDLVALKRNDVVMASGEILVRVPVLQRKTGRAVRFEINARTRRLLSKWLARPTGENDSWLFPSDRKLGSISTRHYARLVDRWAQSAGLKPRLYGTHSLRQTNRKALRGLRKASNV